MKYGELSLSVNIDDTVKTYANLQRSLEEVFIRKKFVNRSDWSKNDMLLDKIYSFSNDMTEHHLNFRFIQIINEPFQIRYLSPTDQNKSSKL